MTGYGRGEAAQDGFKIVVELSSVNRKQGEIAVTSPKELEPLDPQIRDLINHRVARGRLTARITLHAGEGPGPVRVELNVPLARAYARELHKLGRDLGLEDRLTLDQLLRVPGILKADGELDDAEHFWPSVHKALRTALDGLIKMRDREGAHLGKELRQRIQTMRRLTARIRSRAPRMVKHYREQLRERIAEAGLDLATADDERLMKEVVYFADRSDISEELSRLTSHFNQFDEYAASDQPVGRTLDFLAQEINREVNTIGAKSADGEISKQVVGLRTELEKFREQVQNVE